MYADDLILVTIASRKVARFVKLCLQIYGQLTGQVANSAKSEVFFPSWANGRVIQSICAILSFQQGSFPFTYLGVLISPRRLAQTCFRGMVEKVERSIATWHKSNIMHLVNSRDTMLDQISICARNFLWSSSGNRSGMHLVNSRDTMLGRSEGGLSIKNLRFSKVALMAKHAFNYLNLRDTIWVDLIFHKYGCFNVWKDSIPVNCSWFFRGLCRTLIQIKPFLWIKNVNPSDVSFLFDPWLFEIPLAFKPTYLNMDLNLDGFSINDFVVDIHWNLAALQRVFGEQINTEAFRLGSIYASDSSHWVWFPKTPHCSSLSSKVYGQLGKVKTSEFLHALNIGPLELCIFCGLVPETIEHLLHQCPKAQAIWVNVGNLVKKNIAFPEGFAAGQWLVSANGGFSKFVKAVVVATGWLLWKARCNSIFKLEPPQFGLIARRAFALAQEYSYANGRNVGKNLILNNFISLDGPFLFTASFCSRDLELGGAGFLLVNSDYVVSLAGCGPVLINSETDAEIKALSLALQVAGLHGVRFRHIFLSCSALHSSLMTDGVVDDWLAAAVFSGLQSQLCEMDFPSIHVIPRDWNLCAARLASHNVSLHSLSLFFQGRDLPRWLMKVFLANGFRMF
ncbi:uncharacterized protein LOC120249264 [Dioscorea cayenensis subsp. rotundata]|uniref:Uncharacterized protein LOC120249264 n=1 Tax=Dioscorea cayennensis subsp. rotundata TaxID=55577 RepID=A0AB40AFM6_DIOCR|nr:uncharacterized protein LOC120249264 [Dioscorea cayenensis subsp. rotundata]